MPVVTVTQVNRYIGSKLKGDRILQGIMVKGEISNFVRHFRSGHCYFSLKDSESSLKAVMFAGAASRLRFLPEDGMSVVVSGSISVFERDGAYQLYANDIIPEGAGKASVELEQLKRRLEKEGIFSEEHKRPLPHMPKKIGAVTSLSGAAVRDIINVLTRRYPLCELYAVNALVQGEGAPESICRGILRAEQAGCDVIIVGRGGGSAEDLSAFNSEQVARTVYGCKVPVISAVGHEVDFTVCDLAADMRAPTPSAAAELAAPEIGTLRETIEQYVRRAEKAVKSLYGRSAERFTAVSARLTAKSPANRLVLMEKNLDRCEERLGAALEKLMDRRGAELSEKIARLEALSPLKVMARGYSLVYSGDELVRSSETLSEGDTVTLRFDSGGAEAQITKKW
ncbi:MAG: exodeoxyribonuclease VII large subunit [Ruminococcus sp.]|nr:exodeoxyribonuclease VII large subunit [Ruminococcus sp.]